MSCDLSVKVNSLMNGQDMVSDIIKVMKKLSNVSSIPHIIIYQLNGGKRERVQHIEIGFRNQYLLLGFDSIKDGISISTIEILPQPPYTTTEEEGLWLEISIGVKKSNLELLLAAATAIVIATKQNTDINDDGQIWSKKCQVNPKEFFYILAQNEKFKNVDQLIY